MLLRTIILFLIVLSACSPRPHTPEYREQYLHLEKHKPRRLSNSCSEYFVILLVDAPHLDYTNGRCLLKTLAKHPCDGRKNSDVGHAWILLKGKIGGKKLVVEGGHSGESGLRQPRYFEGVMNYIEFGCSNPAQEERLQPGYEPNPIKYLWEPRKDGFYQKGAGGHRPTYAIKINLTRVQFESILRYINEYDYSTYAITGIQCSTFVSGVAEIAGLDLLDEVRVPIPKAIRIGSERLPLWEDEQYSLLTLSTPDTLERSMMLAVEQGKAEYALPLYLKQWKKRRCPRCHWQMLCETIAKFPYRYKRAQLFGSP